MSVHSLSQDMATNRDLAQTGLRAFPRRLAAASGNVPFLLGGAIIALLLVLVAVGPELAPHDPYVRQPLQWIDGELFRAPIEPRAEYPLGTDEQGRDILSMLLHGARTTLTIAVTGTALSLLLGFILGGMAGWWEGRWIDRAVMTAADFLSLLPGLIMAVLIVYAVGIRSGQVAFVAAVAIVGWAGAARMARGHVQSVSKQDFIAGAQAIGLSDIQILSRHVVPNLTSVMLSVAAIQIGAALLLLGELGFLSVFLGGGTFVLGDVGVPTVNILEIPDWGAMLGTTWRYFRTRPWLPGAPALAFFVAILGFNLFGRGLQNFIDRGRFYPSGWSILKVGTVIAGLLFAARFVLASTSPENRYAEMAATFKASRAWDDLEFLTQPALAERSPGSEQSRLAASYIARSYAASDLTPLRTGSYFQSFEANRGTVSQPPELGVLGARGEVVYSAAEGLAYDPLSPFNASGFIEGELRVFGDLQEDSNNQTGGLVFYFAAPREPVPLIVRVVPDDELPGPLVAPIYPAPLAFLPERPSMLIGERAARELLAAVGEDYEALSDRLEEELQLDVGTGRQVRATFGLEYAPSSEVNVVGYIPGNNPARMTDRILVAAPYTVPEGTRDPTADRSASGVAVMLEVIRQWQEQGYTPKRTVVFAAVDELGGFHLVQNPILPTEISDTWTVVIVDGVGAGQEPLSRLSAGGGNEGIFDRSARKMGVDTERIASWPFFFTDISGRGWSVPGNPNYSGIAITREAGPAGSPGAPSGLDPRHLESAGEVLSHFLISLAEG